MDGILDRGSTPLTSIIFKKELERVLSFFKEQNRFQKPEIKRSQTVFVVVKTSKRNMLQKSTRAGANTKFTGFADICTDVP